MALTRQAEAKQDCSERLDEWLVPQIELLDKLSKAGRVQLGIDTHELTDGGLVQGGRSLQEVDNGLHVASIVLLGVRDQLSLSQIFNPILPLEVELYGSLAELSLLDTLVLKYFELIKGHQGRGRGFVLRHRSFLVALCVMVRPLSEHRLAVAQVGSMVLQTLAHFAFSDLRIDRSIEAAEHLHENLHREAPENLLLLRANHALVLVVGQLPVGDLR